MSPLDKQILINVSPGESRVAIVEDGRLQTIQVERENQKGLLGNIYKGKVVRVVPGMQAAFIDIGLAKKAFLHVRDIINDSPQDTSNKSLPIEKILHEGQFLLGQINKEAIGEKGARLTTEISFASNSLVYLPKRNEISLSHKIVDQSRRLELTRLIQSEQQQMSLEGGFIVRTEAELATPDELKNDMQMLLSLWNKAQQHSKKAHAPKLLHEELPLVLRALCDRTCAGINKVTIDSQQWFEKVREFAQEFLPRLNNKLEFYDGMSCLFDQYGIEKQIEAALDTRVGLDCGGDMVIEQTEAMTTVDINSGSFLGKGEGHKSVEKLSLNTNLDAARCLAHQLRLRNLGGIIVVDFIDMPAIRQRQQVLDQLRVELEKDTAKTSVSNFSALGLVEITRQRTSASLSEVMNQPCSNCLGRGHVKTVQSMCYEILRELLRQAEKFLAQVYTIVAIAEVVDLLNGEMRPNIEKLQKAIDRPIRLQLASHNLPRKFEIVSS